MDEYLIILKVNGKTLATRNHSISEYNEKIAWSSDLNKLMLKICDDIDEALKQKTTNMIYGNNK